MGFGMRAVTTGPRLGLTMMSFAREIYLSVWDLGECLQQAGRLGPGTALELTGAQSLPGYPALLPDVERTVRRGIDAYGLIPACYDAYAERGRRYGRTASLAETAGLIEAELAIARRLGFPMLRLNDATPDLLAAILPTAERLGIRVVVELHAKPVRHPDSVRLAEYFDAMQSPCLGFLQDLGAMMRAVPRSYVRWGRRSGRRAAIVEAVERAWNAAAPLADTLRQVSELGGSDADRDWAYATYVMFHRNPAADLELVMPYLAHVHGKFFGVDACGAEPAIDYPSVVAALRRGGYEGIVSSEYISWAPAGALDSLDQVAAHHRMLRTMWQAAHAGGPGAG
jgi:sugar phosphate isomerase/epimerase